MGLFAPATRPGTRVAAVSLILDTLRRKRQPADAPPGPPRQADDAPAGPALSAVGGSAWAVGQIAIAILFVVILGVCGWVLIEWLLAL